MPNTIAEYYTDELMDWSSSIIFYEKEIAEFSQKLGEVISRNTITGIAEKVEARQDLLNQVADTFHRLQTGIQKQEEVLITDGTLVDNDLIKSETEKKQNDLRHEMQEAEKKYIDVKFECYEFLSGTLTKK